MSEDNWTLQIMLNQVIHNRLSMLEERVQELEKRVPYWSNPEVNIFEHNEALARSRDKETEVEEQ